MAKAHADVVLISGYDGGTGASPMNSLKHAGTPWEIGLAETQQTLLLNGLRDRITVQVDGAMRTGRDVVVAALLGAEEFGFATAPLIVAGCVMMRVCHLDTCPVGVATQNPDAARALHRAGRPRGELLRVHRAGGPRDPGRARFPHDRRGRRSRGAARQGRRDRALEDRRGWTWTPVFEVPETPYPTAKRKIRDQDHGLDKALDRTLIQLAEAALEDAHPVQAGAAGPQRQPHGRHAARRRGHPPLRRRGPAEDDTIHVRLTGSAGQSLGAFLPRGITLEMVGDANDYVGKGLSGGRIIVRPHEDAPFRAEQQVIAGNVIGYGATSGEIFLRGRVGERFCVRNSGAIAVAEGVGDHAFEYMTGGRAVVLGPTGRNLAAGMSGGIAYVLDLDPPSVNTGDGRTAAPRTPRTCVGSRTPSPSTTSSPVRPSPRRCSVTGPGEPASFTKVMPARLPARARGDAAGARRGPGRRRGVMEASRG